MLQSQFKALMDYKKLGDSLFDTFIHGVQLGMTNNPAFPSPPIKMTDFGAAADLYSAKLLTAKGGGKVDVSKKNDARKVVEGMLSQLVRYVNYVSNGDRTTILSSGLSCSGESVKSNAADEPGNPPVAPAADVIKKPAA